MKDVTNGVETGSYGSATIASPLKPTSLWLYRDSVTPPNYNSSCARLSNEVDNLESEQSEGSMPKSRHDPRFNTDVDSLITRITDNVVIRDKAVINPLWVQVPRGFLMEEAITPATFYKSQQHILNKRKRTSDVPSKKIRRGSLPEPHGFRPQEVNGTGAVSLEHCRPSTLTNDIHPLFDRSCFDDVPDAIYDELVPGLQLATMFLTQRVCMQFWVTLAMGERSVDGEMSEKIGKTSKRIQNHVDLTQQRADSIINRIKDFGKSKVIHFRFKHKLAGTRSQTGAWGLSDPICDYRGIQKAAHGQKDSTIRSIIRLHADYYVVAKKLSQLKYPEVSQKLRFNFLFASLIMHELAHSIEGIHIQHRAEQWVDWQTSRFYKEPYWLDWQSDEYACELGRAWEETMFGGEIAPINNRADGSHGIGTCDWPPRGSLSDPERRVWHTVSMEYIEGIFQMETWQRDFDLQQWRVFNIPRDGATSLYLNYFTTMSQDEEQRIANQELADLMEIEREQPAKKKRVTASGDVEDHRLEGDEIIDQAMEEQEQEPEEPTQTRRQVSQFFGTRRLSSVMPGPLPDDESRLMLTPQTRKPSSAQSRRRRRHKVIKLVAKTGYITHEMTSLQRQFIEDQRRKDKEQRLKNEIANRSPAVKYSKAQLSTSTASKGAKARPKGLLDRHRQRKKTKMMDEGAKEQRKAAVSANATLRIKEDLSNDRKNQEFGRDELARSAHEKTMIESKK